MIKTVKQEIPEAIIFADVSNMEEAARAVENGADIVAPSCTAIQRKQSISRVRITVCLRRCAVPSAMKHSS